MQVTINLDDSLDDIVAKVTKLKKDRENEPRIILFDWMAIKPVEPRSKSIYLGIRNTIPQDGRIPNYHSVQLTQSDIRKLIEELRTTLI